MTADGMRAGDATLIIDGAVVGIGDGLAAAEVTDPATQEVVGRSPVADEAVIDSAARAAARAFGPWSGQPASVRGDHLTAVAAWIRREAGRLATMLTLEQGKPLSESLGEIEAAAKAFDYYAAEAVRVRGSTIPTSSRTQRSIAISQPIGVVAAIATWNYPVGIMAWKLAPALAAGCTVVAKPAEQTPLTVLALIAGAAQAGLPAGVLNSVSGPGPQAGAQLAGHPLVRKISFTGGTATGRKLLHLAADDIKSVTLELGGHSPMVVLADAPLEAAVADGVKRSFRNAGQLCNSVNRVFVERVVAAEFIDKFTKLTARLLPGHGLAAPEPDLGPLTTADGLARVEDHVADARLRGAEILTGGARPEREELARGHFYSPTVVVGDRDLRMVREETFGPVVPIVIVDDEDEAVGLANSLEAGLVAYLYTRDLRRATVLSEQLEFGTVNVNNVGGGDVPYPYAGWKQSGLGVELSREGLHEFLRVKHVRTELGYQ
ncbi:MAG TPA: aldehyde dehydrogenase family protein [Streptosporangiaceae bacterium]|nr:aldehyde dehydrogenase family protein [Streptosporangiaceae bacterium]